MTSINESVSLQNLASERATLQQSMTSEGNSALLPANVDRRRPQQRGLMNFKLHNFQLYNKSVKDWYLGKQFFIYTFFSQNLFASENIETTGKQS